MEAAYCTNAVAGRTLAETRTNVERVFAQVRRLVCPHGTLPLGLWLSQQAATELAAEPGGAVAFRAWLHDRGLVVTTLNAFPYHGFHGAIVKREVYEPNWADTRRLLYTTQLADLLPDLLPEGTRHASISTLPIGWRQSFIAERSGASIGVASAHLQQLVRHLARVEDRTGIRVHVDLEPEPGCLLDRARDVADFFAKVMAPARGEPDPRRYIGVCHDVCHAAVMFEGQREVLMAYRDAGVRVGKVQISSAPACTGAPDELAVLASFAEPRYLHQTCVRHEGHVKFFEDLPTALAEAPEGQWRTHFHVPVFAERLGAIGTTQAQIGECLRTVLHWPADEVPQFEVETYAWDVLPHATDDDLAAPPADGSDAGDGPRVDAANDRLVQGIAEELRWAAARLAAAREGAAGHTAGA